MVKEGRVQLKPELTDQLPKAPVDRQAKPISLELLAKIGEVKQKGLLPHREKEAIKELKKQYGFRISFLYQNFYNKRLNIAKGNIGSFYSTLFDSMFTGMMMRRFKTDKETLNNGDEVNFHPDHLRYEDDKKIFTEVKAISIVNSKPMCSARQLENYCFDLLNDAEQPLFEPQLEYAFFRYNRDKDDAKTCTLSNQGLLERLAHKTQDLLIVPHNLLFLMMLASNKIQLDQTSNKGPDEATYYKIYGTLISQLHSGEVKPVDLARGLNEDIDLVSELCLDNLEYTQTQSPSNLAYGPFRIKPFTIKRYQNEDSKRWLKHFRKNHKRILTDIMGLRDIYEENNGVPF